MSTRKRFLMVFRSLITSILIVIASLIAAQLMVVIQRPPPVAPSGLPNSTLPPHVVATGQVYAATREAEYRNLTIEDLRIAYLIAENVVEPESLVSEQTFSQAFGAQPIHSWDEFVSQNAQQPYQVILIHKSLYEQVDTAWTQWAYRNKVILMGISMPFEYLVEITGDRCQENVNAWMFEEYENLWLYFTYDYQFDDEQYRDYVAEQYLKVCNGNLKVGQASGGAVHGFGNAPITRPESLNDLAQAIIHKTVTYRLLATKRDAKPTPTAQPTIAAQN